MYRAGQKRLAAATTMSSSELSLLCRSGTMVCAVPLHHVAETLRPLPTETLAGAPHFVAGVAVVRGAPVPVVALDRLLGSSGSDAYARFVMARTGPRTVAIAVQGVLGIRALDPGVARDLPPLLSESNPTLVAAMGALDSELLLVLEATRVVPDAVWNQVVIAGPPS